MAAQALARVSRRRRAFQRVRAARGLAKNVGLRRRDGYANLLGGTRRCHATPDRATRCARDLRQGACIGVAEHFLSTASPSEDPRRRRTRPQRPKLPMAAVGAARVAAAVTAARAWLASNFFAPAWRELRRCAKLCEERGGGMRRADAVSGVATFVVAAVGHRTSFEARVPAEYPARVRPYSRSSPRRSAAVVDACHKRCTELARKLSVGEKLSAAAEMQSPATSTRRKNEPRVPNTAKHFQSLRRDTKQLKQIADLRAEGSKTARQDLVVRTLCQRARPTGRGRSVVVDSRRAARDAAPVAAQAVEYLVEFATSLPGAKCGVCGKAALGGKLPRALCGCWFHHQCLKRRFEAPPFKIECEPCGRRVWHESWPNPEKLEAAYYAKQHRTADADLCASTCFSIRWFRRAE